MRTAVVPPGVGTRRAVSLPVPTGISGSRDRGTLPTIVGAFKSAATRRINQRRETPGEPVWQRGYYEHVVCSRRDLERIRHYIRENPARWHRDRNRPDRR